MVTRTIAISISLLVLGVVVGYLISWAAPLREVTSTMTVTSIATTTRLETINVPIYTTMTSTQTITTNYTVTEKIEWPRILTDALGRKIEIPKPPNRIVSTAPSITEEIYALGLLNRLVGVDSYSNYPSALAALRAEGRVTDVGGPWTLDLEKIINLKPDIVFMCRGIKPQETQFAPKLEESGVKTFFLICDAAKDQYDIYTDLRLIALATGVDMRTVDSVIESIQRSIDNVTRTLSSYNLTKPKVLVLLGPPSWGLWSAGGDTFINWMITVAGGVNIASSYSGWPQLSYEYILSKNPDVIIVAVHGVDPGKVLSEIRQDQYLKETSAVKNNRVYIVTGELGDALLRPGPRISLAVEALAKIFYPQIFGSATSRDIVSLSIALLLVRAR